MNREIDLSFACYGYVKELVYDLAILPWGAIEPHNLHLPYLTDCILSHDIAVDAALKAWERYGVRCMVMPFVSMGSQNPGQRELPFCVHSRYETQKAILTDVVSSLYTQGMRRLVIVNGHGGNSFKNMIRDLSVDYPDFLIASSEWFRVLPVQDYFECPGDHADEVETSVMLHYHSEMVDMELAGNGKYTPFAINSLRTNVAWIPRNWQKVSTDTGIGNPQSATANKGKHFAEAISERYAQLFKELVRDELYQSI